jgi:hypothetical protein
MSQGFPGRASFADLGGKRRNRFTVTDPETQVGMDWFGWVQWQLAGLNKTGALVSLTVNADGEKEAGGEAWNSADEAARRVEITHTPASGVYVIAAQDASYTDWEGDDGTPRSVEFTGAIITPRGASSVQPPTYTLDSPTQITVYTWDAVGAATDMAFTIDIK